MKATHLVIHHSATDWGCASVFDGWHRQKGWRCIGYTGVIPNGRRYKHSNYDPAFDGIIEEGRGFDINGIVNPKEKGAHTLGYNYRSFGWCLVGNGKFTDKQMESLITVIKFTKLTVPDIKVIGHNEVNNTSCPGFDVQEWLEGEKLC